MPFCMLALLNDRGMIPPICHRARAFRSGSDQARKVPQVSELVEVDKSTATVRRTNSAKHPSEGTGGGQRPSRMTGTVKWYSPEKRFGFVAIEGGQREVFVHATALRGLANLTEGQRVALEVIEGRKGLEALSVSLTD